MKKLLQEQHEACQRLTENKDKLINEYMNELKQKEDFYVKELEREAEEIGNLIINIYIYIILFSKRK